MTKAASIEAAFPFSEVKTQNAWEWTVVGTEPDLTEAEKLRRKLGALRP